VPGLWPSLDLVPTAGVTLGAVRDELVIAGGGRESRLSEALRAVSGDYDLILIDCAPEPWAAHQQRPDGR
jgi:chromosome partitioning protein